MSEWVKISESTSGDRTHLIDMSEGGSRRIRFYGVEDRNLSEIQGVLYAKGVVLLDVITLQSGVLTIDFQNDTHALSKISEIIIGSYPWQLFKAGISPAWGWAILAGAILSIVVLGRNQTRRQNRK